MSVLTEFPGSRWWRVDIHNHTPASSDYDAAEAATLTSRDWLLAYMRAGVDAVAVTDHNCSDWIDRLQSALVELSAERPVGYRTMVLFPGVEVSTQDGLHILGVFAPGTPKATLDGLLQGRLTGWDTRKQNAEQHCAQSAVDVMTAIHDHHGLAIPAHADKENGVLFGQVQANGRYETRMAGSRIDDVLNLADALELHNPTGLAAQYLASRPAQRKLALVTGSDAPHHTRNAGRRCCWVKMSSPTGPGLRLALMDPESAVRPGAGEHPQPAPNCWIRRLSVENLHLRRGHLAPLTLDFNPAYNAVIGGRGSGKSTVVECLRLALARGAELNDVGEVKRGFDKFRARYQSRDAPGMMLDDTRLTAEVVVGDGDQAEQLRYQWTPEPRGDGLLKVQRWDQGQWQDTGLSSEQAMAAFPVRIYSQKQVLALAKQPQALLGLIDEALGQGKQAWQQAFNSRRVGLMAARRKLRALQAELARKPALELEHSQASRKALVFTHANFGPLLKDYQRSTQQQRAMDDFQQLLARDVAELRQALEDTRHLPDTELTGFDAQTEAERDARQSALALQQQLTARRQVIVEAVAGMEQTLAQALQAQAASAWQQAAKARIEAYRSEMQRLKAEGIDSAQAAAEAVAAVERLSKQLDLVKTYQSELPAAEAAVQTAEDALTGERGRLTELRRAFVEQRFASNVSLRIRLGSMAHAAGAAATLRDILKLPATAQWNNVWADGEGEVEPSGFLWDATMRKDAEPVADRLVRMKQALESGSKTVLATPLHGNLLNRLKGLTPEDFDKLAGWFPDDEVLLDYSAHRGSSQSMARASDGQRAAAMLSFLLAYGDEPLVLDQPEDDLDNALVSDLVVAQLRDNKSRRQVIVVTHNPNIVVNGDADLVLCMQFVGGQIADPVCGGLQETIIRQRICDVMEGGREAFKQRYKRILEDLDRMSDATL